MMSAFPFIPADIDGDGREDLLVGSTNVNGSPGLWWFAWRSQPSQFVYHSAPEWYGEVGDVFRAIDIDGDGDDDLMRGQYDSAGTVDWSIRRVSASGATWASEQSVRLNAGDHYSFWYVADVDGVGRDDLVRGSLGSTAKADVERRMHPGCGGSEFCGTPTTAEWSWYPANNFLPQGLSAPQVLGSKGLRTDLFSWADADGDGDGDLYRASYTPSSSPPPPFAWRRYVVASGAFQQIGLVIPIFCPPGAWVRVGDVDGNGEADLLCGDPDIDGSMEFWLKPSAGTVFSATTYLAYYQLDANVWEMP